MRIRINKYRDAILLKAATAGYDIPHLLVICAYASLYPDTIKIDLRLDNIDTKDLESARVRVSRQKLPTEIVQQWKDLSDVELGEWLKANAKNILAGIVSESIRPESVSSRRDRNETKTPAGNTALRQTKEQGQVQKIVSEPAAVVPEPRKENQDENTTETPVAKAEVPRTAEPIIQAEPEAVKEETDRLADDQAERVQTIESQPDQTRPDWAERVQTTPTQPGQNEVAREAPAQDRSGETARTSASNDTDSTEPKDYGSIYDSDLFKEINKFIL